MINFHYIGPWVNLVYKWQCPCIMDVFCVPSVGDRIQESWRLLIKDRFAKKFKLRDPFFLEGFINFLDLKFFGAFGSVFVNQPTVHSRGVSKGTVAVAVGNGDR